jgi:hypothetical protein
LCTLSSVRMQSLSQSVYVNPNRHLQALVLDYTPLNVQKTSQNRSKPLLLAKRFSDMNRLPNKSGVLVLANMILALLSLKEARLVTNRGLRKLSPKLRDQVRTRKLSHPRNHFRRLKSSAAVDMMSRRR